MSKTIMGFVLHDRINSAGTVQELLTKYGDNINTRLGLHIASDKTNSTDGLILLEFTDNSDKAAKDFENDLKEIAKVDVQKMVF